MSHHALTISQRDEENAIMTDKKDEPYTSAGPMSHRSEILQGLARCTEQLTALVADECVRAAIAHAQKSTWGDEQGEFSTVPGTKSLCETFGDEAVRSAVAFAPTSARDIKCTGTYSASATSQSSTSLLRQARKMSEPSLDNN